MTKELEKEFIGTGETKGFKFTRIASQRYVYLYEVSQNDKIYYEVFKRLKSPVCIDFEKRIYSDTEFKEIYPKANSFGVTAWTLSNLEYATKLMYEMNDEELGKQSLKNK